FSALLLLPLPSFPKHAAGAGGFDFDYFLSLIEFSCLLSSAFASVCVVVVACLKKELLATIGSKAAVWGTLALVFGVLSGAWIRRRQWRRVCRETVKDGLEVNLLQRIEKLEEDLRSTSAISKVLSRELEKLEIRFRVTRKTLKEPVTEDERCFPKFPQQPQISHRSRSHLFYHSQCSSRICDRNLSTISKAREWNASKAHKMKPIVPSNLYRSIRNSQLIGLSVQHTLYSPKSNLYNCLISVSFFPSFCDQFQILPVFAIGVGLSTFDKASVYYYVQSHIQINEYRDRVPSSSKKHGQPITTCVKVLDMTDLKFSALNQIK
ncbi:hypothetical protein S83_038881, partial [Arachis hypogaea]